MSDEALRPWSYQEMLDAELADTIEEERMLEQQKRRGTARARPVEEEGS